MITNYMRSNQKVKVVRHQTVSQYVTCRQQMLPHFPQKVQVVIGRKKYTLLVITPIINVVKSFRCKYHQYGGSSSDDSFQSSDDYDYGNYNK